MLTIFLWQGGGFTSIKQMQRNKRIRKCWGLEAERIRLDEALPCKYRLVQRLCFFWICLNLCFQQRVWNYCCLVAVGTKTWWVGV